MKKKIYLALLILPFLTSCGLFSSPATGEIEITLNDDESFDNYYSPEEVRIVDTYKTLQFQTGHIVMPSTGDVNVLVVPIIIRGYEETATESYLSLLDEAFNSTSPLKGGYPSVHTYYEESSFGKLNILPVRAFLGKYLIRLKSSKSFSLISSNKLMYFNSKFSETSSSL